MTIPVLAGTNPPLALFGGSSTINGILLPNFAFLRPSDTVSGLIEIGDVTGGVPPYRFSWTGTGGTIASPTSQQTKVSAPQGSVFTYTVVVTDSQGSYNTFSTVVTFTYQTLGGSIP